MKNLRRRFKISLCWITLSGMLGLFSWPALAVDSTNGKKTIQNKSASAPAEKTENKVFGQCTIMAGNGNMEGSPCVSLTLKLDPGHGKDVLYTRTNAEGEFEFTTTTTAKYSFGVVSRFYEIVEPKDPITGTKKINLQLRQK